MPDPASRGAGWRTARPLLRGAAAALVGAVLASCAGSVGNPAASRPTHADRQGVLWANVGEGGMSMEAPPGRGRWVGTFGGFSLCRADPGVTVELDDARLVFDGRPIRAQVFIRATHPDDVRQLASRRRSQHLPFYSALGSAPGFAEPYAEANLPGRYTEDVAGTRIDTSCEEAGAANAALSRGLVPGAALTELVIVLHAGPRGTAAEEVLVDYRADGEPRTLRLAWSMVLCGSAARVREHCP